ncbi:ABC transporter ATP-binding protein [Synoicihabitans lomoniglobus]|uniref:ABC transporter ATP-binding protein n=1 Tax=Synoicihabitans lomoniglobus TaxID=2909285 RepID=A0AAE9ZVW6_9BACT|nr:ABC transporter ATP-binding protein [Opitutaceae bacterium LMO-M01]WED65176.1 ABC transporter ATP-binding protein [Opitutaceae bacterium LMO-M01]
MSAIVEATNLSRFYGIVLGLNNVTFKIQPGITGVVGPNGAGKTTLFRLLTGQIKPSSGTLSVFGSSPWSDRNVRAQIAYCPEDEAVPANIKPQDWLIALGMISGLSASDAKTRAKAALQRVNLAPAHWNKSVHAYSKGMKQRVKLAQCLMHEPRLIILDEPMNGLDPMGREEMANVLRDLAAHGTSVVISSHILQDLEALCREFILLRWGRLPKSSNATANARASAAPANGAADPANPTAPVAPAPRHWPGETTVRCEDPARLARFFFERDLLRGCDLDEETSTLVARWRDPAAFYEKFNQHLLDSGVPIHEVSAKGSQLERAIEPPPLP